MENVWVVQRPSEDGTEIDIFTDYQLAQEWAAHVDSEVEEEPIIDRETFELMKESYGPPAGSDEEDDES